MHTSSNQWLTGTEPQHYIDFPKTEFSQHEKWDLHLILSSLHIEFTQVFPDNNNRYISSNATYQKKIPHQILNKTHLSKETM